MARKTKSYMVIRDVTNDKVSYSAGDVVTQAQMKKVFSQSTIEH